MVFIFVAMMVPRILLQIYWSDILALVVLIAAAFAARAVSLYGLLPLMRFGGLAERVSAKFKLVMLWGGLRGAVTLVLALGDYRQRVPCRMISAASSASWRCRS